MKTGSMPSTSVDKNVNGKNKNCVYVDPQNLMVQGESKARMNRLDLARVPSHGVESGDSDMSAYT